MYHVLTNFSTKAGDCNSRHTHLQAKTVGHLINLRPQTDHSRNHSGNFGKPYVKNKDPDCTNQVKMINIMCLTAFVGIGLLWSVASIQAENGTVAFTAGFHEDQTIEGNQIVAYKDVFTNLGNGYNSNTGVFTSPSDGLYVFSINALTISGYEFYLDLYHNDKYVISAFARNTRDYANGGNSVVLRVKKGERVYVKSRRTSNFYNRASQVYATLTGYQIGSLNSKDVGKVAFTAGITEDQTVEAKEVVVYKEVFTNYGNGYNSSSGVFTATKAGLYVFTINALTQPYANFWIDLYLNDIYQISAFARNSADYAFGANSVVLRLVKNDRVYVKAFRTAYLYGRSDEIYATFTGILIGTFASEVGNVAFTAGFKEHQTIGGGQIIAYKEVYTNYAGGYDSNTGVFTAPKAGVYVFIINALTQSNSDFWIELYHNDNYLISAYARLSGDYATAGNSIVLRLETGSRVYVKTYRTVYLYGGSAEVYTTFNGFLIGL